MTDLEASSFMLLQRNISYCRKIIGNSKKSEGLSCSQEFNDRFQRESRILYPQPLLTFKLANTTSQMPKSQNSPLNTIKFSIWCFSVLSMLEE